jgi:asparagine synthase (glutamine-hydrolysing)
MTAIAGVAATGKQALVESMLDRMGYRGTAGRRVTEEDGVTLGICWTAYQGFGTPKSLATNGVYDLAGDERLAEARIVGDKLVLTRDALGVAPLYFGWDEEGALCFASEVKALLLATNAVQELPPGCTFDGVSVQSYARLDAGWPLLELAEAIAAELRRRLEKAVQKRIGDAEVGSWLSGGLDSSGLAALARPHVRTLHTFAAGLPGAPDLTHAKMAADFIRATHHEVVVDFDEILAVLPKVIYHLESFDALLVRSSITNYLVAKTASDYVPAVLSGEGGDELFAGYDYLKRIATDLLGEELLDITGRLHNTALQRVDRSASAHGTVAHVPFLDPDVVAYALCIPVEYKIRFHVEKWILRKALQGALPSAILDRPKAKFWEGTGVGELLARHAEERITNSDFRAEQTLPNRWQLNSKEELLYYRLFREFFGEMDVLAWMGRTKGAASFFLLETTQS